MENGLLHLLHVVTVDPTNFSGRGP